ncbi:MAG TPA: TldD/PmbA family protein [Firmicutes bacterium]|nr:TldD/PmbA family protein [Candidatus Fermentithermobacillaceae bacterium]
MQTDLRDLMSKALKHSTAEYCEIRIEETEETVVRLRGNDTELVAQNVSVGGNVRALYRGGWGFISFNRLDNLEKKVEEACAQARILGDRLNKEISLYPVDPVADHVHGNFGQEAFAVPLKEKMELLEGYNRLILGSPEITSSSVSYMDRHTHLHFANSDGTYIYQEKMDLGGGLTAIATKDRLTTQDSAKFGSNHDYGVALGLENEVMEAAGAAREMLHAPVVEAGQYTVILDPDMAGLFVHEAFGHLSESDDLDEDERMKELLKIGTRYGSDELHIYDSGIEGPNRGESKYDDEGVPMQKTYLIKNGVVVGHLHCRESAAKMNEHVTGNARALNYRFPPIVRMRTTCIASGKHTFEEMLQGVSLGVYVKGGYGGQTNGEMFTFAPSRAYMIRNGAIAEMVRDVNLSGNVFDTLRSIDMIGNDFEFKNSPGGCGKGSQSPLPVAQGSPHIRIQKVVIGGEKK